MILHNIRIFDLFWIRSKITVKTRKIRQKEPKGVRTFGADCTVGRISHGTFWFQHALFQNFLKSIYSFPWTLWIFLRWFRGRANHELLIYYINFNPTERILCLKHEKRNKRFKLVGTKTFAAECTGTCSCAAPGTIFFFKKTYSRFW